MPPASHTGSVAVREGAAEGRGKPSPPGWSTLCGSLQWLSECAPHVRQGWHVPSVSRVARWHTLKLSSSIAASPLISAAARTHGIADRTPRRARTRPIRMQADHDCSHFPELGSSQPSAARTAARCCGPPPPRGAAPPPDFKLGFCFGRSQVRPVTRPPATARRRGAPALTSTPCPLPGVSGGGRGGLMPGQQRRARARARRRRVARRSSGHSPGHGFLRAARQPLRAQRRARQRAGAAVAAV